MQQAPGGMSQGGPARTPSTTVILNLSREKLNRGGARPIFPSMGALPSIQNMQRMQQQGYGGMQQGMGGMQQGMGGLQQGMGGLQQGMGGLQQGMGGMQPGSLTAQLQLALLQQQQQQQGSSLGGMMQGSPMSGGLQGLQGMPSVMAQGTLGGGTSANISLTHGLGGLSQQDQLSSLLAGGAGGAQQSSHFGQQQSSLLSALQNQQGGMLGGQGSGAQLGGGGGLLTGSVSSNPQLGLLSASLMSSSHGLSQQKSQGALGGLGGFGGSSMLPTSRVSKPLLQTMETLKGGAPGVQGISGSPAIAGTPAPIVMSQPVTSAGLAPQMQHLLLKGMPGYTSTLVLILVPQD